jgi:ankyrin repeat protein
MPSSRVFAFLAMLVAIPARADQPWEPNELGWLVPPPPARVLAKERVLRPPEHFATIQADGNFVAPQYAQGIEAGLLAAVARRDVAAVRELLKSGASPNARDYWQDSALLIAVRLDDSELVQLLLDAGSLVDVKGRGYTPLGLAARNNNLEILRLLLRAGADPDRKSDDGDFPLHSAVRAGHVGAVEALLQAHPDLLRFDREGLSALALASSLGNEKIAALLLDAGAPVEWGDKQQRSPLWWAVYRNKQDMARYLLKRGAEIGAMSVEGVEEL